MYRTQSQSQFGLSIQLFEVYMCIFFSHSLRIFRHIFFLLLYFIELTRKKRSREYFVKIFLFWKRLHKSIFYEHDMISPIVQSLIIYLNKYTTQEYVNKNIKNTCVFFFSHFISFDNLVFSFQSDVCGW